MRILALALTAGLWTATAMAQQSGGDAFLTPGAAQDKSNPNLTPPPIPSADAANARGKTSQEVGKGGDTEPWRDLTFADVEGAWTGTVDEVDQDPYVINLTFRPGGLGEVSYSGYNCEGVLGPLTQGSKLVFKETITKGRDICADGTVEITPEGSGLNWTWINEWNEVQATAVLRRSP
ncbi:MAG: hypothetical protein AAF557_04295 [Pseudomonadota bacterium]